MKMGRFALTLAIVFLSSVAFTCTEGLIAGDLPSTLPESADTILLPTESEDPAASKPPEDVLPTDDSIVKLEYENAAASKLPEEEFRTVESNEEVTTLTFRPADHRLDGRTAMPVSFRFPFRHRRPCRHRRRPFNPSDLVAHSRQVPYGNDMIMATKEVDSDSKDSQEPIRFHHHHHHHHHSEPEREQKGETLQMKRLSGSAGDDDHDMKKFHRGHPHFEREREDEEEEHHHHQHHHDEDEEEHHHHQHHHDEDEEEEKGGLLIKFRKFLMDRF